jgi:SAM-dependent methyltransferase
MDRDGNAASDLAGALDDIGAVNRLLGGARILVAAVRRFAMGRPRGETLTILDVGTGGGDLPLAIASAARAWGRRVRIVAVDRDPATAAYARVRTQDAPEIEIREADALDLAFPAGSFDLVTASLFLHHFGHGEAVSLVAAFRRIARRAVLVNDLRRHLVPWAFIGLAARATRRHPMFVHDAPLSVLRGFTEDELRAIAREAGASDADTATRFPFRVLMTVPGAGAAR